MKTQQVNSNTGQAVRLPPAAKIPAVILGALCLIAAGIIAYHNSFSGVFLFDDSFIVDSPQVHYLWPLGDVLRDTNRPVLNLSFALNYVLGGIDVRGYHAFNLFIHISAALILFGIMRRTLYSPRLRERYAHKSLWLALIVALIWMVHPLQTASVTYISQRAESMMGLFYLFTLYCSIRVIVSRHKIWWTSAAIAACALGMGTKEVMVTAPLVILIYDRVFYTASFKNIFIRRWKLYLGLAATWVIPVFLLVYTDVYKESAGFNIKDFTPLEYALTQPGVILRYLRLVFYPDPLCFDYHWPVAKAMGAVLVPASIIGILLLTTILAFFFRPATGFLGVWFFMILSVTSSFIPIKDMAFEHRMYLSLAAVIILVVFAGEYLLKRFVPSRSSRRLLAAGLVLATTAALGWLTISRNTLYASEEKMWRDVVAKRPGNARGFNCLGLEMARQGRRKEAKDYLSTAIFLKPNYEKPYNNLGNIFMDEGKFQEAMAYFFKALEFRPESAEGHTNIGMAFSAQKKYEKAKYHFHQAIRFNPGRAEPFNNLGMVLAREGRYEEAAIYFLRAVKLKPHFLMAYNNLGSAYISQDDLPRAVQYSKKALQLDPNSAKAYYNLGLVSKYQGRLQEAADYFSQALRIDPKYHQAQRNLADVTK